MSRLWTTLLAFACAANVAVPALAFPVQDDHSPGVMAQNFRRQSNVWSRLDLGVVDAKVTSSPPDSTKYDRRLEAFVNFGGDLAIQKRYGVRANVKAEYSKRKQAEDEAPRAVVEDTPTAISPSLDATFITNKGLELYAGAMYQILPKHRETVVAPSTSSDTTYDSSQVLVKRIGVVRRAGPWTGGFYYVFGVESDRHFEKTASDGSTLSGEDTVFIPPRIGITGEFAALASTFDFELAFIQARGKGPKDEAGTTLYSDYFEARVGAFRPFGPIGLKLSAMHKTLSYSSNAFVTFDSMPVSSVKALFCIGGLDEHAFVGVIGAYGKDGQSLPEFNAEHELAAFAITSGFVFPL